MDYLEGNLVDVDEYMRVSGPIVQCWCIRCGMLLGEIEEAWMCQDCYENAREWAESMNLPVSAGVARVEKERYGS